MISLYDGQITDLLPWKIAQSTEVRCISYAVQQEHQRMLRLAAHTRTMAVIDELPERILDVLAVELRTPYYQESMNLETKEDAPVAHQGRNSECGIRTDRDCIRGRQDRGMVRLHRGSIHPRNIRHHNQCQNDRGNGKLLPLHHSESKEHSLPYPQDTGGARNGDA